LGNKNNYFGQQNKEKILEILFSSRFFNEHALPDYARSGNIATADITINAGPLEQFQHTMEPQLRQLGMHTSLIKGKFLRMIEKNEIFNIFWFLFFFRHSKSRHRLSNMQKN
jgi:hypothetical protein